MKRLQIWTALIMMIGGSFGSCEAWAQTGNPTALPPGAPNTPTAPRAPATSQPAGRPGTTISPSRPRTTTRAAPPEAAMRLGQGFDAGFSNPRFGDRFSTPSGFSGAPATLNQFNQGGNIGGFTPGTALRGRPNFSGGSTSATLRPASPMRGGPNPGNPGFIPDAVMDGRLLGDSVPANVPFNNFRLPIRVPVGAAAPNFTVTPQISSDPSALAAPVTPQTATVPALPVPGGAPTSAAADVAPNVQATAVEPLLEPQGVATATAFPVRERASGEATATASRRSTFRSGQADFVEIPSGGGGPRTTGFRGAREQTGDASAVTSVYPGYTLWQGYYWYHSPAGGWHYWDGSRWTRF